MIELENISASKIVSKLGDRLVQMSNQRQERIDRALITKLEFEADLLVCVNFGHRSSKTYIFDEPIKVETVSETVIFSVAELKNKILIWADKENLNYDLKNFAENKFSIRFVW